MNLVPGMNICVHIYIYMTGFGKTRIVHTSDFSHSRTHKIQKEQCTDLKVAGMGCLYALCRLPLYTLLSDLVVLLLLLVLYLVGVVAGVGIVMGAYLLHLVPLVGDTIEAGDVAEVRVMVGVGVL